MARALGLVLAIAVTSSGCSWIALRGGYPNPPVKKPDCANPIITAYIDGALVLYNAGVAGLALYYNEGETSPEYAILSLIPATLAVLSGMSFVHGVKMRGVCKAARDQWQQNQKP